MGKRGAMARFAGLRAARDEGGSAAVVFALIAPVFLLILAATFEIGLVIRAKFQLISVVSAASNHTLAIGDTIDEDSAQNAAAAIVALLGGGARSATVNVNNAVTAQIEAGTVTVSNTGAAVADYYCPSRPEEGLVWGGATDCTAACGDGSQAGRFVEIAVQSPFAPVLGAYGLFSGDALYNSAVVRLP